MDPRIPHAARLQQQKNYAAAEQIYRQVIANQPRNVDALLLLGLLLHETGRNEASLESLMRADRSTRIALRFARHWSVRCLRSIVFLKQSPNPKS